MDFFKFHAGLPCPTLLRLRASTPETALWPFKGWPVYRLGRLQPSSTPLDTPRRTPMRLTVFWGFRLCFAKVEAIRRRVLSISSGIFHICFLCLTESLIFWCSTVTLMELLMSLCQWVYTDEFMPMSLCWWFYANELIRLIEEYTSILTCFAVTKISLMCWLKMPFYSRKKKKKKKKKLHTAHLEAIAYARLALRRKRFPIGVKKKSKNDRNYEFPD
jgi:hypothetical protein